MAFLSPVPFTMVVFSLLTITFSAIFSVPRSLFTTKAASASPSTSSAMITNARPFCAAGSNTPMISFIVETFLSVIRINGFSMTASIFSESVMK